MKRQQLLFASAGLVILLVLFFFGRTTPHSKPGNTKANTEQKNEVKFEDILTASKQKLNSGQLSHLQQLENAVIRGDVKDQQTEVFNQLSIYWRDSIGSFLPAAYYAAEAAKLENREKSLTFAAHLFLDKLRTQSEPQLKTWMAGQAKELFEKALELNPANDSSKVGLGSCYLFGNLGSNPMQGILMIREVADRDPHNAYAQMTLGIGSVMTGQFDKAIDRFKKVIDHQPNNLEAMLNLAEAYEQKGEKAAAKEWYEKCKTLISNPAILKELDARINSLK